MLHHAGGVVVVNDWREGDFVEVQEFRRAFGFLAATDKASLSLSDVTLDGLEVVAVEIGLLRTNVDGAVATIKQGGSCTLAVPAGTERPPFLRVRALDGDGVAVHEGDVKLPAAATGVLSGARLMSGATPATLTLSYEIADLVHEKSETEIDWRLVWECLPAGWEDDGRLDKSEFDEWMGQLYDALPPPLAAVAAEAIDSKISGLRMRAHRSRASSLASDASDQKNGSRGVSPAGWRGSLGPGSRKSSVDLAMGAVAKLLNSAHVRA